MRRHSTYVSEQQMKYPRYVVDNDAKVEHAQPRKRQVFQEKVEPFQELMLCNGNRSDEKQTSTEEPSKQIEQISALFSLPKGDDPSSNVAASPRSDSSMTEPLDTEPSNLGSPDSGVISIDTEREAAASQWSDVEAGEFAFVDLGRSASLPNSPSARSTNSPITHILPDDDLEKTSLPSSNVDETTLNIPQSMEVKKISQPQDETENSNISTSSNDQEISCDSSIDGSSTACNDGITKSVFEERTSNCSDPSLNDHQLTCSRQQAHEDLGQFTTLNVPDEFLDSNERELRQMASKIKEMLLPIAAESKSLTTEREFLKSKIAEQQADISVRAHAIVSLSHTSTTNKDKIAEYVEEQKRHIAMTASANLNLVKAELALRELQVKICQDKLKVASDVSSANSVLNSVMEQNESKLEALKLEVTMCAQKEEEAKAAQAFVEDQLGKLKENDLKLRSQIEELEVQQKAAETLLSVSENSFKAATVKLKMLTKQRKMYSVKFVNLERMLLKIKMCRKFKRLDEKEADILGKQKSKLYQIHAATQGAAGTIQYSSQVTVFGGNSGQPSVLEIPTSSALVARSSSYQHFASLQSFAFQNFAPWFPQHSLMPTHMPRLEAGKITNPTTEKPSDGNC